MHELTNISTIDGRYAKQTKELCAYMSEAGLMRYRLVVEIEYFIALSNISHIIEFPALSVGQSGALRLLYKKFTIEDALRIKEIEQTTNHDVKAIEYFLREKLKHTELVKYDKFIHFALTSEDVNNIAYSLMWKGGLENVYIPILNEIKEKINELTNQFADIPMLSLTHGQSASPTTVGKELKVYENRLDRKIEQLIKQEFLGKFGGATGVWSAHCTAYPSIDWIDFSKKFIKYFGLKPNLTTTQIEPHDSLVECYSIIRDTNSILIDFCTDIWMYISRAILGQKKIEGEIGSSTMPHKINPINFENAEGNCGLANAIFSHLCQKLPISRMQRDLIDSTTIRNQGSALAYSLIACKNILKGLNRLTINEQKLKKELDEHWEVLAEPIQTILRKYNVKNPYEKMKQLTRGQEIDEKSIKKIINNLDIAESDKDRLLALTPSTYTGLASRLARGYNK